MYLSVAYGHPELAVKITFYDSNFASRKLELNTQSLLSNLDFLELLLTGVFKYDESRVFESILENITTWDAFFEERIVNLYMQDNKLDYMVIFLRAFN